MKFPALLCSLLLVIPSSAMAQDSSPPPRPVRVAVINGMIMTGFWQALMERFTKETLIKVELKAAGERPVLDEAFRKGGIDFLTMHSGDITTNLVTDGLATGMRPWVSNELVIAGPVSDPAGIKGMKDGVAALKQIVERGGKFVDFRDIGSREVFHTVFTKSGLAPDPKWLVQDTAAEKRQILIFSGERNAYCTVGSLPIRTGRMPKKEMATMVEGDPGMRRPFVLMTANPKRFPEANHAAAEALAEFLLKEETQKFIEGYGKGMNGDAPYFFPVAVEARGGR
ncbi:MAG: hypothetical protein EOP88_26480 [Verrucomicrobiaceae bacterium]|nr:MAG: hypothetical protein EOP88_26480 [Verrucomicrobiaceae bacterium]